MDIHNANEDLVFHMVQTIFKSIEENGNPEKFCLCQQCSIDTICFTLNRIEPHYIVSNRGLTRHEQVDIKRQQIEADITTLVYKGIRLVNHNLRPTAPHDGSAVNEKKQTSPVFDIPTIAGRIFNGETFEPIIDIEVFLYCEGEKIAMRNNNWQNPYTLVQGTPGAFSFWPAPIPTDTPDVAKDFNFSLRVNTPQFEPLSHFFTISATSRFHNPQSFALNKTFKLPDLYLFPPGGEED